MSVGLVRSNKQPVEIGTELCLHYSSIIVAQNNVTFALFVHNASHANTNGAITYTVNE